MVVKSARMVYMSAECLVVMTDDSGVDEKAVYLAATRAACLDAQWVGASVALLAAVSAACLVAVKAVK